MVDDLSCAQWRKSSYSNSGNCVEVALLHGLVAVRDSKDEEGSVLLVTTDVWAHFIAGVKRSNPPLDPVTRSITATSRETVLLARR